MAQETSTAGTGAHVDGDLSAMVREAWVAALGHTDFSDDDDFFSVIGAHSVLVARIMGHLGKVVRRRLSLRLFFDNATVNELARALSGLAAAP